MILRKLWNQNKFHNFSPFYIFFACNNGLIKTRSESHHSKYILLFSFIYTQFLTLHTEAEKKPVSILQIKISRMVLHYRFTCRQYAPVKAPWDVRIHCKPSVFRIVIMIFRQIKTISFVDYAFERSGTKAYLYKNTTHLLNGVSRRSKKVYSNGISSTFKY